MYAGPEYAAKEREKAKRAADDRKRGEQYERKLIREIEQEEERAAHAALADPPPELSPAERIARETAERLERVETEAELERRFAANPRSFRVSGESQEQNRRREALRLLRIQKDAEDQDARNAEHEKRCAKQISRLEEGVEEADAALAAEDQRHAQARADLTARRVELDGKRQALTRALARDETSEQRERAVMA
jgi:hypothetical protein